MWNVRKEHHRAIEDLNSALKFNQYHTGALLLRGSINQPIQVCTLVGSNQGGRELAPQYFSS